MNKPTSDELNDYIDNPQQTVSDARAQQIIDALQQRADGVQPRHQFVQSLSTRLQAEAKQNPHQPDGLMMRWLPKLAWGAAITAVGLFVIIWLLPWLQTQLTPSYETSADTAVTSGDVISIAGRPSAETPAELPLYHLTLAELPTNAAEARTWAEQFGIDVEGVYTRLNFSDYSLQILGTDGRRLSFNEGGNGTIYYQWDTPFEALTGTAVSFADASHIALQFLEERGLLPMAYQVIDGGTGIRYRAENAPVRLVDVLPELSGFPLETAESVGGMRLAIGPDGEIVMASFMLTSAVPGEMLSIRPADEVLAAYQQGDLQPLRTETHSVNQGAPSFETFLPPHPEYTEGDSMAAAGFVDFLQSAETGELIGVLSDYRGNRFTLKGELLADMAAKMTEGFFDFEIEGTVTAVQAENRWEVVVQYWEPSQIALSSVQTIECLRGVFSRVDGDGLLTADNGRAYRFLYPPEALAETERIEMCGQESAQYFDWDNIMRPPPSETEMGQEMIEEAVVVEVDVTRVVQETIGEETAVNVTRTLALPDAAAITTEIGNTSVLPDEVPFELGQTVVVTGLVDATIFGSAGEMEQFVYLNLVANESGAVGVYPVSGTEADLADLVQNYYGRMVRMTVNVVEPPNLSPDVTGILLVVDEYTAVYPDARLQNYLGHMSQEVIADTAVTIFTDSTTGTRYAMMSEWFGADETEQVLLTAVVVPNAEKAGLPMLWGTNMSRGEQFANATDVSQFPVEEEPPILPLPPAPPMATTDLVLDRMVLVYLYTPHYEMPPSGQGPAQLSPTQTAEPVWKLYGRSPDGTTEYILTFKATAD